MARAERKRKAKAVDSASGVHIGANGEAVVTEALTAEEVNALAVQLADLECKHEEMEIEVKEATRDLRKKLKLSTASIRRVSRQIRSGVREVPAQQSLKVIETPFLAPEDVLKATCADNVARLEADLRATVAPFAGEANTPEVRERMKAALEGTLHAHGVDTRDGALIADDEVAPF